MSRRRAGRASLDEVLAQAEEAPVEAVAPVEASAARSRRRQVNVDTEEGADAGGVAGAALEQAPSGGAAVRRARFQPSVERESDGSEDVGREEQSKDEQSDLTPQELVQVVRSKEEAARSKMSMIEISIPATRVNTVEDPPLQLLNVKKNDSAAQVGRPRCSARQPFFYYLF
jgi:hypothetical protein